MSQRLGSALPPELLAQLSQRDLPARLGHAIPVVTVDDGGRPHPMLCSYLELLAVDPSTIRLAIGARGRSAVNLEVRAVATLVIIEPERTVYIKGRAIPSPVVIGELKRFELSVEEVLEDEPAAWEGALRITGGITYGPVPSLDEPWARATLAALRANQNS